MSTEQPGLRMRLDLEMRRMAAQHARLRTLYDELRRALASPGDDPVAEVFARYEEALHAHFSMEERVAFPAVHGLRPGLGPDLEVLVRDHASVCERLYELGRAIDDERDDCMDRLQAIAAILVDHEAREEGLVARVRLPAA